MPEMIAKPDTIIEGTWEEVSRRSKELEGKRVRVVVLEEASAPTDEAARKRPADASKMSDEEQAELRRRADEWLKETEKLVREPSKKPPTEFEQILIEKMRKQGIHVE